MERTVLFRIESERGHDEEKVPESKVAEKINQELKDGKWVTVESGGKSEIITAPIPAQPKSEPKKETTGDWQSILGGSAVKAEKKLPLGVRKIDSVTSTTKLKGG